MGKGKLNNDWIYSEIIIIIIIIIIIMVGFVYFLIFLLLAFDNNLHVVYFKRPHFIFKIINPAIA